MKLFQYAVIFTPSESEKKKGDKPKLIVEPSNCLAPDVSAATLIAGRAIPEEYLNRLDQVEVAVRPF